MISLCVIYLFMYFDNPYFFLIFLILIDTTMQALKILIMLRTEPFMNAVSLQNNVMQFLYIHRKKNDEHAHIKA